MKNNVFENEAWWQNNGMGWADEVEKRRSLQPLYGIQEVVLTHIFSKMPKDTKVLEFGVGFGRHVDYLSDIPNIEVYGVDQSPTMLESLKNRLSHKQDLIKNITLIEPRTKLPYPDNYFDFVYTVSVLIHINPADIEGILLELIRVAKHGVIHFENNFTESSELKFMDHNGCWQHSLVHDYSKLNLLCSVLTKVASEQDIYYIKLSDSWSVDDIENKVMFSRLQLMDDKIRPTIAKFEGEIGWRGLELKERIEKESQMQRELTFLEQELLSEKNENDKNKKRIDEQTSEIYLLNDEKNKLSSKYSELNQLYQSLSLSFNSQTEELESKFMEVTHLNSYKVLLESRLYEIESSLAWRSITKLRSLDRVYRLSKPVRKMLNIIRKHRMKSKKQYDKANSTNEVTWPSNKQSERSNSRYNFLENKLALIPEGTSVAIHQPEWLGVSHSTQELFPFTLPIKELFDANEIMDIGNLISKRKPKVIIFSGFAIGYYDLAKYIKSVDSTIQIKIYWHGNTTHMYEDYSWSRYQEIIQLCNEGIVSGWGFAKKSMADLYEDNGFPSFFVKNTVKDENFNFLKNKEIIRGEDVRIGIYASGNTWNKNAYTQIAAVSLIKNASINAIPYNNRMKSFAQQLNVKMEGADVAVPREELLAALASNDINFYVTFSECAPLLPLESMNLGIPCLTGPNHHYFEGSPLKDYLIVNRPDDPIEIAKKAEYALKNKREIMDLYGVWKAENDIESESSVQRFLEEK
ncbi:methyltransferase domain-containing protein [Paenibacillus sp. HW567]|uniref:methyltransferase domain-containing protein n=1 Tax=Paenibacillus sp. HW567 TaxID=1034769 RepID=UPI0003663E6C|nr:methyltransferase domain-containing protein [Paenibacillus sp. HW567]